jgi:hypothetical protein
MAFRILFCLISSRLLAAQNGEDYIRDSVDRQLPGTRTDVVEELR